MKVHIFTCEYCGYESKHSLGSSDMDQILTDVNADYSQYRLFVCSKERRFVHVDVLDRSFDGKCPTDQTELRQVDPEHAGCPRCGKELKIQEFKPLSAGESTAAQ